MKMNSGRKNLCSWLVLATGILLYLYMAEAVPDKRAISFDIAGYYLYLPAQFIYHDLDHFTFMQGILDKYHCSNSFYQVVPVPPDKLLIKYSMGMAVLYSPFFFLANALAPSLGYPADGFSMPYQYAVFYGSLLYTLLGMFLLRRLLLKFFPDQVTAVVLGIIFLGTNFYINSTMGASQPHNYLFTIYVIILMLTAAWHEKPKFRYAVSLGIFLGLAVLIRPTHLIGFLIPLLWGVRDRESWKNKVSLLKSHKSHWIAAAMLLAAVCLPQLLYWKHITGKFLFYSYQNPGEGMDLLRPHLGNFLFSFRKGWLVYTPLMALAVIGFIPFFRKYKPLFWPLLLFAVVFVYLVASWSCWWYAGCFSQRSMIEIYPVLAFPMAALVNGIAGHSLWKKGLFALAVVALILLNLFQTWQFNAGIIDAYRMTGKYYFRVFGSRHVSAEDAGLMLVKRPELPEEMLTDTAGLKRKVVCFYGFEDPGRDDAGQYDTAIRLEGRYSYRMDSSHVYSPGYRAGYRELTEKEYAWIRATLYVYPVADPVSFPASLVMTFDHRGGSYKYKALDLEKLKLVPGQWNKISMDYMTPEVRSRNDRFTVYFWNRSKKDFYIDNLEVEVYEPRE